MKPYYMKYGGVGLAVGTAVGLTGEASCAGESRELRWTVMFHLWEFT